MATTVSFSVDSSQGPRTVSVAYERTGAGEPLLLLHGIGHHHQAWDPVLSVLAVERDVIAVDLPGFGVSPDLPEGLSYDLPAPSAGSSGWTGPMWRAIRSAVCWRWGSAGRSSYGR